MFPLLDPLRSLTTALAGLGLLPAVFTPLPGIVDTVAGVVNSLAAPVLVPLGLQLVAVNGTLANGTVCSPPVWDAATPGNASLAPWDPVKASLYRYRQQRSVNLGGWFVHEAWMTPSLFTCSGGNQTSELDLAMGYDGNVTSSRAALEKHWDTFITVQDFAFLSSLGINTVRLPIGFWTLGPDALQNTSFASVAQVYNGSWPRFLRALSQAEQYGIGVLVDLHGVPGSQNGLASSGESGTEVEMDGQATVAVLTKLVAELAEINNVVGLELMNDPTFMAGLYDFYDLAIETIRATSPSAAAFPLYIQDSYLLSDTANYVASRSDFLVVDHHQYFTQETTSPSLHSTNTTLNSTALNGTNVAVTHVADNALDTTVFPRNLVHAAKILNRSVIIGEFTCTLDNRTLAKAKDPMDARREFCMDQMGAYSEITAGYHFWSYTGETCSPTDWCFKDSIGKTLPSSFESYPGAAGVRNASDFNSSTSPLVVAISALTSASKTLPMGNKTFVPMSVLRAGSNTTTEDLSRAVRRHIGRRQHSRTPLNKRTFELLMKSKPKSLGSDKISKLLPTISPHVIFLKANTSPDSLGYDDGFSAAKAYALEDFSKLGFVGQYVKTRVGTLVKNGTLVPGDSDAYSWAFAKGLGDGEAAILKIFEMLGKSSSDKPSLSATDTDAPAGANPMTASSFGMLRIARPTTVTRLTTSYTTQRQDTTTAPVAQSEKGKVEATAAAADVSNSTLASGSNATSAASSMEIAPTAISMLLFPTATSPSSVPALASPTSTSSAEPLPTGVVSIATVSGSAIPTAGADESIFAGVIRYAGNDTVDDTDGQSYDANPPTYSSNSAPDAEEPDEPEWDSGTSPAESEAADANEPQGGEGNSASAAGGETGEAPSSSSVAAADESSPEDVGDDNAVSSYSDVASVNNETVDSGSSSSEGAKPPSQADGDYVPADYPGDDGLYHPEEYPGGKAVKRWVLQSPAKMLTVRRTAVVQRVAKRDEK